AQIPIRFSVESLRHPEISLFWVVRSLSKPFRIEFRRLPIWSSPHSLITIGGAHHALPRFRLRAAFEGIEPSGVAVLAPGGAGLLSVLGGCQRAAHRRTHPSDDLASRAATFAERSFHSALRRWLVPARAVLAAAAVPGDCAVGCKGGSTRP